MGYLHEGSSLAYRARLLGYETVQVEHVVAYASAENRSVWQLSLLPREPGRTTQVLSAPTLDALLLVAGIRLTEWEGEAANRAAKERNHAES